MRLFRAPGDQPVPPTQWTGRFSRLSLSSLQRIQLPHVMLQMGAFWRQARRTPERVGICLATFHRCEQRVANLKVPPVSSSCSCTGAARRLIEVIMRRWRDAVCFCYCLYAKLYADQRCLHAAAT